jgi:hypothetical protein
VKRDSAIGQQSKDGDLRQLGDPEFFARWAEVRHRLILTAADSPERAEVKPSYDALKAEYQRRIDGGMTLTV